MRILFDLVHPAHALFFHNAITVLKRRGAEIAIASRDKDVLVPLLDGLGHPHTVLSSARDGAVGLAGELAVRDWRLWRMARQFRPDLMASCGGVSISHVGSMLAIPSLSFYDTEHAALQNRLAVPFITEWHVQESWKGPEARQRTFRFAGTRHSAYVHPDYFTPDAERAKRAGWEPGHENFLIRVVAWRASHDIGKTGMTQDDLRSVVEFLGRRGRVHISSEALLPEEFEPHRYRGGVLDFHHLLAKCRLCFGESATVASEAVALGVPTVFYCDLDYGYIREQVEAGLILHVHRAEASPLAAIEECLALDQPDYVDRARAFIAGKEDVNSYIVDAIFSAAEKYRKTPVN